MKFARCNVAQMPGLRGETQQSHAGTGSPGTAGGIWGDTWTQERTALGHHEATDPPNK